MVSDKLLELKSKLPSGVTLVAVSKFHPVDRIREAYDAGHRVFAESRPQELAAKVPLLPADIQWHFIGHLQTNKLKLVLPSVSLVQSVDSLHLLEAIDKWGSGHGRVVDVLLEVHIAADITKQGFSEEEVLSLVKSYAEHVPSCRSDWEGIGSKTVSASLRPLPLTTVPDSKPTCSPSRQSAGPSLLCGRGWPQVLEPIPSLSTLYIRIRGLMGMASLTEDMTVVEGEFARLEALFQRIREAHPELAETFTELSIGMSADWPLAVRHGATMVRIGTDIFGAREY